VLLLVQAESRHLLTELVLGRARAQLGLVLHHQFREDGVALRQLIAGVQVHLAFVLLILRSVARLVGPVVKGRARQPDNGFVLHLQVFFGGTHAVSLYGPVVLREPGFTLAHARLGGVAGSVQLREVDPIAFLLLYYAFLFLLCFFIKLHYFLYLLVFLNRLLLFDKLLICSRCLHTIDLTYFLLNLGLLLIKELLLAHDILSDKILLDEIVVPRRRMVALSLPQLHLLFVFDLRLEALALFQITLERPVQEILVLQNGSLACVS